MYFKVTPQLQRDGVGAAQGHLAQTRLPQPGLGHSRVGQPQLPWPAHARPPAPRWVPVPAWGGKITSRSRKGSTQQLGRKRGTNTEPQFGAGALQELREQTAWKPVSPVSPALCCERSRPPFLPWILCFQSLHSQFEMHFLCCISHQEDYLLEGTWQWETPGLCTHWRGFASHLPSSPPWKSFAGGALSPGSATNYFRFSSSTEHPK